MSVRQYIGARYVPRFSDVNNGNWSSVYSYEPLIIVKHGNDYYTSKKSVPVGVQITDTEYWVKTGDYNGAILNLDTRMTSAENDIDNIEGIIPSINANIKTLGHNIYNHKNADVVCIGDSWGDGGSLSPNMGWVHYLPAYANVDHLYMSAVGGSGFVRVGIINFLGQLQALETQYNKEDIDLICVCGNVNDVDNSIDQIVNGIKAFVDYVDANYPNAIVYFLNINRHMIYKESDVKMPIAGTRVNGYKGKLFYFDLRNNVSIEFLADASHITTQGYDFIAQEIASVIHGVLPTYTGMAFDNVYSYNGGEIYVKYHLENGRAVIEFSSPNNHIEFTNPVPIGGEKRLIFNRTVGTLNISMRDMAIAKRFRCVMAYSATGSSYDGLGQAELWFNNDNTLTLDIIAPNNSGNAKRLFLPPHWVVDFDNSLA